MYLFFQFFYKNNFILGGTGDNRIPSGVINVMYYVLAYRMDLESVIGMSRIYSYNDNVEIEVCQSSWCTKKKW